MRACSFCRGGTSLFLGNWGVSAVFSAVVAAAALCISVAAGQNAPANLVRNGSFEADVDRDGRPDGWQQSEHAVLKSDGRNRWLLLDGGGVSSGQNIPLKPEWWRLTLSMRMKATGVVRGKQSWQDARLAMAFYDKSGKRVGPWPNVFHAVGTTDWIQCRRDYYVPWGATELQLGAANFGRAGTAEFDDIRIVVSARRPKDPTDASLPAGVVRPWAMESAWRRANAARERVCLNGLWRFAPVATEEHAEAPPPEGRGWWGWFKVPGTWPGRLAPDTSGDVQAVRLSPWFFRLTDKTGFDQAWYRRTFTAPPSWKGRRILLDPGLVQTHARVRVDGRDAGRIWFPGGRLDLTDFVRPGMEQTLDILVTARPLAAESTAFMAPDRIVKQKATVRWKGLVGDVFLDAEPERDAIQAVHVITSVRRKTIAFEIELARASGTVRRATVRILRGGRVVRQFEFPQVHPGRNGAALRLEAPWSDPDLWDLDTPENLYDAVVTLDDATGGLVDESLPIRFGFREFRIQGRDFYLNDSPIHLRALLSRNINSAADKADRAGGVRTCRRLKAYGFNFLITSNYNFAPGAVSYMNGLLEAADTTGYLVSFSLPHVKDFNWNLSAPDQRARYRAIARWIIRRVWNHPSVATYAMNHNACGYFGDQNPLKIDGRYDPDTVAGRPPRRSRAQARIAAGIVEAIDPTRPVYHHQSGNLGEMHTVNIYLNWAPRRERSNWLEHWATTGTKPVFFVEWGLPHISSWSSYRGPRFIWRYAAFQRLWDSEFAAAIKGEGAYRMTKIKQQSLDLEERLWATGKPFHWYELIRYLRGREEDHLDIKAWFAADNWRSHRTWGASAMLPWDQGGFWTRVKETPPTDNPAAFKNLQQPGIVPDRFLAGDQYIDDTGSESNFEPTILGRTFLRWNRPVIAYIAGKPGEFTERSGNFRPGETVRKQLIVVNDSRRTLECRWSWRFVSGGPRAHGAVRVRPGERASVPIAIPLSPDAPAGRRRIEARFDFDHGLKSQQDAMDVFLLPVRTADRSGAATRRVVLFDPKGLTSKLLQRLGVSFESVRAEAVSQLSPALTLLVIGREALGSDDPSLELSAVPKGLNVLVFEQSAKTLADRFGFRINVHGLRRVFLRTRHPGLSGIRPEMLENWRGKATLTPPYLDVPAVENGNPKWKWCGFENTRVWRCGNEGNVASVLIEKPPRGNWLPLVDGGFDLQYAPLLEYREGKGRIVFCQLDVTGRTEPDPAADRLCRNLLLDLTQRAQTGALERAMSSKRVFVLGDGRGRRLLETLGVLFTPGYDPSASDAVLVVGPGAKPPVNFTDAVRKNGLRVLCLGLGARELERLLPGMTTAKRVESTSDLFRPSGRTVDPALAGISAAELHWRTKLAYTAVSRPGAPGAPALRVLRLGRGVVVLNQAPPWMFDSREKPYLRTTSRRSVFLAARLLANLGVAFRTPVIERFRSPPGPWMLSLNAGWKGRADPDDSGREGGWQRPGFADSAWQAIHVGATFESQRPKLKDFNGAFWYRLHFRVPASFVRRGVRLWLGPVDDESWVWLNGKFLGQVTKKTRPKDYWVFPREYALDRGWLNPDGENVLVVRVNDTYQTGGMMGTPYLAVPAPWLDSYYVQKPESVDDPYRYYRW
ncbi:MAG: hypothetical protein GXP31_03560 [Kiritimatiellaeota bacterium]|nr:hypothetical protein [Kiritimatiellota bacterium]